MYSLLRSPGSVANYISALSVYIRDCGILTSAFTSYRMGLALDAVARQKLHRVHHMSLLSDPQVATTITWLHNIYGLTVFNLDVQLIFYTGLGQSEVTPVCNQLQPYQAHNLGRCLPQRDALIIYQKWSKPSRNFPRA